MAKTHRCRQHLIALLVWTLLWSLFFFTILAGIDRLPASDLSGQFHAYSLFQAREMAQGRLPFWSPGSYAGIPFAADTQAAAYYLPRWLTVLFSLPWGFTYYALELEALLHIWLAGVFAYALAYSITREPFAALLAAVAFGLGGYLTSYPLLQLAILETIAWLPLALLLLRIGVKRARPVPWLVGAGLVLALSALAGHPQTFLHVSYTAAAYYLYLTIRARWPWRWVLGLGALVAAVTVGTWSAALWPTLQYLPYTVRSDVSYRFVSSGLPLLDYVQVMVPGVLSLWSPEYCGLAAVALAALAVLGRRQAEREVGFWGILVLLSAWLALGDKGVLFELAYHVMPGFSLFQHQERLLGVFSLGCAVLAAEGLALWLQANGPQLGALMRRLACIMGGSLLVAGAILAFAGNDPWPLVWVRQAAVLAFVIALLWGRRWRLQRACALVLVVSLDLYVSTLGAVPRQPGSPTDFWPQPDWLAALQSEEPLRLDSRELFGGNLGELYGLEDIGGTSPLKPRALEDLEELPKQKRWQLLNVTYVLAPRQYSDVPLTEVVETHEGINPGTQLEAAVYRFDAALPRAWMSYQPRWASDSAMALSLLNDPAFDPATDVILQGEPGSAELSAPAEATQPLVRTSRLGTATLQIDVETEAPGYLIVSEWHYPGWQAEIDGRRVPILTANYAFQAVQMPAGKHSVVVRFVPSLERVAALASLLTLLIAGLVAWRWRPTVRPRQAALPCRSRAAAPDLALPRRLPRMWPGVVALMLLAFGLRVFRAGQQELRGDEAISYLYALKPLAQIAPTLLRVGVPHPPLHYWLLHVWMGLAGSSEFSMRYASLMPSVLLLPLLLQLGRRLGGWHLGALLAGLAALSQSQVWMGQDARNQYTLVMLFSTLAALLLVRAVERPRWYNWGLYAAACILTLYSHYYGVFALAAQGLCMLCLPHWRRRLWAWAASVAVVALAFLPWFLAIWPRVMAAGQLSDPSHPELAAHLVTVGVELTVGSAIGRQTARWLFLGALALCVLGARQLYKRAEGWAVLLTVWLVAAVLGIYLLRFSRATFNTFYIMVASVPWWALVGVGLQWLWQQRNWPGRVLATVAIAALVAGNGVSLWNHYTNPEYSHSSGYRSLAAQVAVQAMPGDVFLRNFPDPCYDYYLWDVPMERAMQPADSRTAADDTEQGLAQLAAQYDRFWFVSAKGTVWDRKGVVAHWLEYNALLEQETSHGGLLLQAYRPLRTTASAMAPLDHSIAGLLQLKAAHVAVNGVPADLNAALSVPAGATVKVTLLWQTLAHPQEGYTVFVHLMSEDGHLAAQHDGTPVFGTRPAFTWTPGDLLLDRHDMVVPADAAPGPVSLLVGVYQSETLARQTWDDGRDTIALMDGQLTANR